MQNEDHRSHDVTTAEIQRRVRQRRQPPSTPKVHVDLWKRGEPGTEEFLKSGKKVSDAPEVIPCNSQKLCPSSDEDRDFRRPTPHLAHL